MKDIAERFQKLEQEMADEKGPFFLFALFLREDAPNVWDVVVSAPWIESDDTVALKYIVDKIQTILSLEEVTKISRVVLIDPGNPALDAVQKTVQTKHGLIEVKDSTFFNLPIKHAYIVTSTKDVA